MKKLLLTISLLILILSSCINVKKENQTTKHDTHKTTPVNTVFNNKWMDTIQLDNGSKWLANMETTKGVEKMKNLLKTLPTNTLDDFQNLALELSQAKNQVIKECTMKGPPHDNLHVWLLPLMEKIDALTETKNLEEAKLIKDRIAENVHAYDIYFK
ncbi:hypothetical protein [Yeosuana sp. AK3]